MSLSIFITWTLKIYYLVSQFLLLRVSKKLLYLYNQQEDKMTDITDTIMSVNVLGVKNFLKD